MKINNIEIEINRKNIKNIYLKIIPPDGKVTISVPKYLCDSEIKKFIETKMDWILKKREEIINTEYQPKLKYLNGEKHLLWGKEYELQLIKNNTVKKAFVNENTIYLPVSKRSKLQNRQKTLNEFYRNEVKKEISEIFEKCVETVGSRPSEVKVRKMKNWGNCRQDKIITLNLNLAKKPKIFLEYVFIHELCHLIEFNHGDNFKKLMDKNCPKWREIKKL